MKVIIDQTTYTEIKAISFAPQTDLTGDSVPINEFQVDIITDDEISIGQYAMLYDDLDNLWANYWITYAEHINRETLRVMAKSPVAILSQRRLPAEYWSSKSVTAAISELMGTMPYTLDSSFANETLTGFVPSQESRARLQWICYVIGAYVKTFFNDRIEIIPIDTTETLIPIGKTFWKPTTTYNDYVTAITATAYSFTLGTPTVTDTYVEDSNGNYYIVSAQKVTLTNPDVPSAAPEKTITVDGLYLINNDNVSGILTHLSDLYFKRTEVDLDVINNAEYQPGEKVIVYADEDKLMTGFIESCSFTFGTQARASVHMVPTEGKEAAPLTITYVYQTMQLGKEVYLFPVGYTYTITNPYIDLTLSQYRYVYRPLNESATGTIVEGENTDTEEYDIALEYHNGILRIVSVDEVSENEGVVTIS